MRSIGITDPAQAQLFGDYLVTQGIDHELQPIAEAETRIWIEREDQIASSRELFTRFLASPLAPQWQDTAVRAQQLREQAIAEEERRARNLRTPAAQWQAGGGSQLTWILLALCVAVTLATSFGSRGQSVFLQINHPHGPLFTDVLRGQVWRLITPILVHLTPMHLLFNLLWLHTVGRMIEGRQGWRFLLIMVLVLAALSNSAQYLSRGAEFCGMTGVVFGLFGYVWVRGLCDREMGYSMGQANVLLMLMWMVLSLTGAVVPNAHACYGCYGTGLIAGAVWGALSAPSVRHRLFGK